MDRSWLHGYANNTTGNSGFMCGYAASFNPAELQHREEEEQQLLITSQIQHHLNQISMHMNMDDEAAYVPSNNDGAIDMQHLLDLHHAAGSFPSSSSSSSLSLRSASLSCSPESSAHILAPPAATCSQYPEVSSHVPLAPVAPYDDHYYHGQYANNLHVIAPAADHEAAAMAPELAANTGAFKRYARHLGPRKTTKPGACGQRMFKTAMSVLAKMHMAARYNQQYYYQASAEASAPPPSVNQLQHMISERKRREKFNDSFHALKTVLPPGAKKDKTSILIRAREYVRSLESKVSELEEKNKSLESRLTQRDSGDGRKDAGGDDNSGEKVQIEITRAAKEEWAIEPRDLCTLKIAVRSRCNMTDVVLRTLQCLKDQMGDDVSLVAMSTSGSTGPPPRAVLTLQIKSPSAEWDEQPIKNAVAKVVADALALPSAETAAAPV
ncbi:putative transcription factor bHLH041 [Phragmites australis]|uniref:putative transcription factor bHLH041 n=1 Tax=Phragmites australis TaxID=29695 RepID=UPI002D785C4A|nr:putative transcription factor bHLH041 [Phragmites australis]